MKIISLSIINWKFLKALKISSQKLHYLRKSGLNCLSIIYIKKTRWFNPIVKFNKYILKVALDFFWLISKILKTKTKFLILNKQIYKNLLIFRNTDSKTPKKKYNYIPIRRRIVRIKRRIQRHIPISVYTPSIVLHTNHNWLKQRQIRWTTNHHNFG